MKYQSIAGLTEVLFLLELCQLATYVQTQSESGADYKSFVRFILEQNRIDTFDLRGLGLYTAHKAGGNQRND